MAPLICGIMRSPCFTICTKTHQTRPICKGNGLMFSTDCYLKPKFFNGDAGKIAPELPAECNGLLEQCSIFGFAELCVGFPL